MRYRILSGQITGIWLFALAAIGTHASAETINVAVASNFAATMHVVKQRFEAEQDHQINIITGSSGKHFAQIIHGAPFDLFLSADSERPRQLEIRGHVAIGQRRIYAIGQLILWSRRPDPPLTETSLLQHEHNGLRRLALANPNLAPYGRAAVEVMTKLGVYEQLRAKLVMGENVSQAFQFTYTGNAEFGFVALSQALALGQSDSGWHIPLDYYQPISQEMVLLSTRAGARALFAFLQSAAMAPILLEHGYVPPQR